MPNYTKKRESRVEIAYNWPELAWHSRLPRKKIIEHPTTIDEFKHWPETQLDDAAYTHLNYLTLCDEPLKGNWVRSWKRIFAVGPFIGRQRVYNSIPFVLVANYRRPYKHLLTLSEILSGAYLEFGILPDLHILPVKFVVKLDELQHPQWNKTKMVSIRWEGGVS